MLNLKIKTLKPRNPVARSARCQGAGAHVRIKGGLRHMAERALRRELNDLSRPARSP
jgi:hypothetical protein